MPLFGLHLIKYKNIEMAKIHNIKTYEKGYVEAEVTSKLLMFILQRDKIVVYNENTKLAFDETKFKTKKDKSNYLITIVLVFNHIKNNILNFDIQMKKSKLTVNCTSINSEYNCELTKTKKGKIKKANILIDNNFNLLLYEDKYNHIKIVKIN